MSELSDEAKQLLIAAADNASYISWRKYIGGETINAGGENLWPPDNIDKNSTEYLIQEARWIGGLEELRRLRLVRPHIDDYGGGLFKLTTKGWGLAKNLPRNSND